MVGHPAIPQLFAGIQKCFDPSNHLTVRSAVLFWTVHCWPGCGANSARQAALLAEVPATVDCFGVNKGCASGMKALTLAAQAIAMGQASCVETAVGGKLEPGLGGASWIQMDYIVM